MKKLILTLIASLALCVTSAFAANVNSDDAATLQADLMGVGVKKSEMIVSEREANGPYVDSADLIKRVSGIGPMTVENNKDVLTFGKEGTVEAKTKK